MKSELKLKRDAEFIAFYKSGETLKQIGHRYGITRERVRQCLSVYGLGRLDGGLTMRSFKDVNKKISKKKTVRARAEQRHFKRYGCSAEYIGSVSDLPRSNPEHPLRKYTRHMKNARHHCGEPWLFTFKSWWEMWQASGKWGERGRGKYAMARYGNVGPFSPDNVEILPQSQISSETFITKPAAARMVKAAATRSMRK